MRSLLQRLEKLQTVYEGTKASVGYWTGQVVCDMPWSDIEKVLVNMEEKGDDMKSAITICLSKFGYYRVTAGHVICHVILGSMEFQGLY